MRSADEMESFLEARDHRKATVPIFNEQGSTYCTLDFDRATGDIIEIRTQPHTHEESGAEQYGEYVYVTNEAGSIQPERYTRKQARSLDKRYLIVTTLLFHGNRVLLQRRSPGKDIDPNLFAPSAHGVAKEVYADRGRRALQTEKVALINMALELNEELRSGVGVIPFVVKVWPGSVDELLEYRNTRNPDDPDTVWLVWETLLQDNGYPLGNTGAKRTRAIFTGVVLSQDVPEIHPDPAEVSSVEWKRPSEFANDPSMTVDLQRVMDAIADQRIAESIENGQLDKHLIQKAFANTFGKNIRIKRPGQ